MRIYQLTHLVLKNYKMVQLMMVNYHKDRSLIHLSNLQKTNHLQCKIMAILCHLPPKKISSKISNIKISSLHSNNKFNNNTYFP